MEESRLGIFTSWRKIGGASWIGELLDILV